VCLTIPPLRRGFTYTSATMKIPRFYFIFPAFFGFCFFGVIQIREFVLKYFMEKSYRTARRKHST
jgi:hypothetical protein